MDYKIQQMKENHWSDVSRIYLAGIKTGNATFQTDLPSWTDWDAGHCKTCRLVMLVENNIVGWASLSPISKRPVYAGVAEVSIYMDDSVKGQGLGTILLSELIRLSEEEGYWTLQAGIFPENVGSIKLHEKCGFKTLGIRKKLGKMHTGQWRDVAFLERRSQSVGIE